MTEKTDIHIHPDMTILDVVSAHPDTIAVFKSFDEQAGECICCTSLFMTIRDVARDTTSICRNFFHTLKSNSLIPLLESGHHHCEFHYLH